jgi:hypothetical protein
MAELIRTVQEFKMKLAHCATILIGTLSIGGGPAQAQDPWDPQGQGTHLQMPEFQSFYIASTSTQTVSAPKGKLSVGSGSFVATVVQNSQQSNLKVRIFDQRPHKNPFGGQTPVEVEYQIVYEKSPGDQNHPLCGKGDADSNWALAIPGGYTQIPGHNTIYDATLQAVSFACVPQIVGKTQTDHGRVIGGGAAAKCVDWGYPPWKFEEAPWIKTASDGDAQKIHHACLVMATADYCGVGPPHTVDGTWIALFNQVAVKEKLLMPLGNPPQFFLKPEVVTNPGIPFRFEAAWKSFVTAEPGAGGALCVTKARWATMPPTLSSASCPALKNARFCENYTEAQLEQMGAKLFSYSLFLDAGLYLCHATDPNAPRWLTNVTDQLVDDGSQGYKYESGNFVCGEKEFEGTVLRWGANGLPFPESFPVSWDGKDGPQPVPLYFHTIASGQYITNTIRKQLADEKNPPTPIGYVLPPNTKPCKYCGAALTLYEKNQQHITTSKVPPKHPFGGARGNLLGYLIKLE